MTNNIEDTKFLQIERRAQVAVFEYLKELCTPPNIIKETTFDEIRNSAIESAKQNIDNKKLSDKEKEYAKAAIEIALTEIAQKFKEGMKQSGRLK